MIIQLDVGICGILIASDISIQLVTSLKELGNVTFKNIESSLWKAKDKKLAHWLQQNEASLFGFEFEPACDAFIHVVFLSYWVLPAQQPA